MCFRERVPHDDRHRVARGECDSPQREETMHDISLVSADELRAKVRFEDLIEPVSRAFQESSARIAENGLITMFPAAQPDLGDVYVKTGTLRGHPIYIVK